MLHFLAGGKGFFFLSKMSIPALMPTQSPIQQVLNEGS
jgi:hypothetical protein